uniref:Myosin-3 n=1 Tax=Anthurium amnicola TaxID=1678845 RepID=A0A1D1Y694_9ARAE
MNDLLQLRSGGRASSSRAPQSKSEELVELRQQLHDAITQVETTEGDAQGWIVDIRAELDTLRAERDELAAQVTREQAQATRERALAAEVREEVVREQVLVARERALAAEAREQVAELRR